MLITKLVVRILDADRRLLGWTEVMAEARGDGCLWAPTPEVAVLIDDAGTATHQSIHWADLNVEACIPLTASHPLVTGQWFGLNYDGGPMIRIGPAAGGLPPVTVRSPVSVSVPVGSLGARTH